MPNNLRQIRESKGISLHDLEKESGVSYVQLWRIEKEDSDPTFKTMCKIARALKTPYYEIFLCEEQNE